MDQILMNQLCELAIARIDSRKVLDQNHKRLKTIRASIRPDTLQFAAKLEENLNKKIKYSDDMELSGHDIKHKEYVYEELPAGSSLITQPEHLKFYKLCYVMLYKSTKFIGRGTLGAIQVNQGGRYGEINTTVKIETIGSIEEIMKEVLMQVSDIVMANNNTTPADEEASKYLSESFRYRDFQSNHKIEQKSFHHSCFSHLSLPLINYLYKKNKGRKLDAAYCPPVPDTTWYEIGRVMLKAMHLNGSTSLSQHIPKALNAFYGWPSRRDPNIPKVVYDSCAGIFRQWYTTNKDSLGRECGWKKKSHISDLVRNGHMPV